MLYSKLTLLLVVCCLSSLQSAYCAVVVFPDPGLDAAVREAIGKPAGDILDTDLVGGQFIHLDARRRNISNLAGIEYCTDLFDIRLEDNKVSDLTPLMTLTNLKELYLARNNISNPEPLAALTGLTLLMLDGNQIADLGALAGLSALQLLWVSDNQITSIEPVANLTALTDLSVSINAISDLTPVAGLVNLWRLSANVNQIKSLTPLEGLIHLRSLSVAGNQINSISSLAGLTALDNLALSENQISDIGPLANLTALQSLVANNNLISDLTPLSELTSLQSLTVCNNTITDLSPLAGLNGLVILDVSYNPIKSLQPLTNFPDLFSLKISGVGHSDISILSGLTGLTDLETAANGIMDLRPLAGLSRLARLRAFSNRITDLTPLANMPNLEWLNLEDNLVYDIAPLRHLQQLHEIYLSRNPLTDIMPLVENPGLTSGALVYLQGNALSQETLCEEIPTLQARWVNVFYDGTCEAGEGCNMFELIRIQAEAIALMNAGSWTLPGEYDLWDVENWPAVSFGDGIPDLWQLRIFADAYCNERHRLHNLASSAYEANMQTLLTEKPECANPWVAACVSLSTGMRNAVCNMFGLTPDLYQVIKDSSKSIDEPFSAEGDCDGDGDSNLDEYAHIVDVGGGIEAFMSEAGENSPFWEGNPDLPAAGTIGLALMSACIIVLARKKIRLKAPRPHAGR